MYVAVIPDLRNDPTARRGLRKVRQRIDPQREQRDASRQLKVADTPKNRRRLAQTLLEQGRSARAAEVYQGALRGIYQDDPDLMLGLAKAQAANHGWCAHRVSRRPRTQPKAPPCPESLRWRQA